MLVVVVVAACDLNQPSKNFMTFSVTKPQQADSCPTVFRLELCDATIIEIWSISDAATLTAAEFINNNRPSLNRQLLIR